MMHPNNWVRNEAITFVRTVISTSHPIQVFLEVQPKISRYLTENIAIINADILKLILPPKIDKRHVDFKKRKCEMSSGVHDLETEKFLLLFQ